MAKKAKSKVSVSEQIRQQAIEQEATKSKRKQHRQRQEKRWAICLLIVCLLSAIGSVAKTGNFFQKSNLYSGAELSKSMSAPYDARAARDSYLPPEVLKQIAYDNAQNAKLNEKKFRAVSTSNNTTGSTLNTILFNGQQQDETGLYYLRARHYDPKTGRFLSHDPQLGRSDDPASLHRYSYAHNDPVNNTDPSGQSTLMSVSIGSSLSGGLQGRKSIADVGAGSFITRNVLKTVNIRNVLDYINIGTGANNLSRRLNEDAELVWLVHGTTFRRAHALTTSPPSLTTPEEPPVYGFSMAPTTYAGIAYANGYALKKAGLFPEQGGAAVLAVGMPKQLADQADRSGAEGEYNFYTPGPFEELQAAWPGLPKQVVPIQGIQSWKLGDNQ